MKDILWKGAHYAYIQMWHVRHSVAIVKGYIVLYVEVVHIQGTYIATSPAPPE